MEVESEKSKSSFGLVTLDIHRDCVTLNISPVLGLFMVGGGSLVKPWFECIGWCLGFVARRDNSSKCRYNIIAISCGKLVDCTAISHGHSLLQRRVRGVTDRSEL